MMRFSRLLRIALLLPICVLLFMSGPGGKAASGSVEGNKGSGISSIAISADGRYVAFASDASNLVPGDTNGKGDVFVRDRQTGETTRVSVDSAGVQGNNSSVHPAISGNGEYVAFGSYASNLVAPSSIYNQLFIHDLATGQTEAMSVNNAGELGNSQSYNMGNPPAISSDGRFVAFYSQASNLIGDGIDTNNKADIFVRDRESGTTTRVSVASDGTQANGISQQAAISADGCHVAFASAATNLVVPDNNAVNDVFVHDCDTNATTLVSVDSSGSQGDGSSRSPSISADGRYVAFVSDAINLVDGDTNGYADVFVYDRETLQTQRVNVSSTGEQSIGGGSGRPAISADGRYVVFVSFGSNLVSGDTNGVSDVFVHDSNTGATTRVSVNSAGAEGNESSSDLIGPAISSDGHDVAFYSFASNLVPWDTNNYCDTNVDGDFTDNCEDAFVHDMNTGETTRVSLATEGLGPDLIVEDMGSAQTFENYCYTAAGLVVVIKNIGTESAGPTTTKVSSDNGLEDYANTPALAPGQSTNVGPFPGIGFGGQLTATANWTGAVGESDESNNSLTKYVSIMTLPTCEPTPTSTPTPTLTAPPLPATPTATVLAADPVGGIAEPPDEAQTSGGRGSSTGAIAALAGAAVVVAMTGGWLARRRLWR